MTSKPSQNSDSARLKRRALMITYVFPPQPWVGVHRTLKYCRYLPESGWTTSVITARPANKNVLDYKLLEQLPADVRVYRTWDIDPVRLEERLAAHKVRKLTADIQREIAGAAKSSPPPPSTTSPEPAKRGAIAAIKHFLKELGKHSPDSHIFWVPFALCAALWEMLLHRVDVIYTTSPPHSSHVIGLVLAKLTRKPLVADFRDPWYVAGSVGRQQQTFPFLMRLATRTKHSLIRTATRVITVSPGERDELIREYPKEDPAKFVVITNGFDSSDQPAVSALPPTDPHKLTVLHAGTMYSRIGADLFQALHELVARDPTIRERLHVQLIGELDWSYMRDVALLEAAGVLKSHGVVPHAQALGMMRAADALLILLGGGSTFRSSHLPSKAYEYVAAEKPIVAVVPEGNLTEILRNSGLGFIVPPNAPGKLAETLGELGRRKAAGEVLASANSEYKQRFERQRLARQLASEFDNIVAARGRR